MAEKHLVVHGALCRCQFGTVPDKLCVRSHNKEFANDRDGTKKLLASTREIGPATFEKNTFGSCAKMNNSPCKAVVQSWKDFYPKLTLYHKGKPLTEDSKAVCPIGGAACISILWHGQSAELSASQVKKSDKQSCATLNPLLDMEEVKRELEDTAYYH